MEIIGDLFRGFQAGRLMESMVFLAVLWLKVKPHLRKVDDRMAGIEKSIAGINAVVTKGFESGEMRFEHIETRLEKVEHLVDH